MKRRHFLGLLGASTAVLAAPAVVLARPDRKLWTVDKKLVSPGCSVVNFESLLKRKYGDQVNPQPSEDFAPSPADACMGLELMLRDRGLDARVRHSEQSDYLEVTAHNPETACLVKARILREAVIREGPSIADKMAPAMAEHLAAGRIAMPDYHTAIVTGIAE